MTQEQAYQIVQQALSSINTSLATHNTLQEALKVLVGSSIGKTNIIKPKSEASEKDYNLKKD